MRSSVALAALPAAADAVSLTESATPWANSAWAQIEASAPANAVLAGILVYGGSYSAKEREIDIGIGAAASEAAIATFRMGLPDSANGCQQAYLLPVPITGIGGQRVSARSRTSTAAGSTIKIAVLYLDNPSADVSTDKPLACVPSGADGVSIAPSGTTWVDSSWVELTSGLGAAIAIAGLAVTSTNPSTSFEFDIGTGGAGSESVITTLRGSIALTPAQAWLLLNGIYTLAASTRIAVRMRKAGTSTTAYKVALIYYDDLTLGGGGGAAPRTFARAM